MKKYKITNLEDGQEYKLEALTLDENKRFVISVDVSNMDSVSSSSYLERVRNTIKIWAGKKNSQKFLIISSTGDVKIFELNIADKLEKRLQKINL